MSLGYVISTTIMKWFVFFITFIKREKIYYVSVTLKKSWHTVCAIGPEQAKI
jgi:hypothetical protein